MTIIAILDSSGLAGEGGYMLMRMEDSAPVGIMRAKPGLPVPLEKLAGNMASFLNGRNPLHRFGEECLMAYTPVPEEGPMQGIDFSFRAKGAAPGDANVSRLGATLLMTAGFEDLLGRQMVDARSVFNLVMQAGCEGERRADVRAASDTRTVKPGAKPKSPRPGF